MDGLADGLWFPSEPVMRLQSPNPNEWAIAAAIIGAAIVTMIATGAFVELVIW